MQEYFEDYELWIRFSKISEIYKKYSYRDKEKELQKISSYLDKQYKTDEIREKYENSSRINPFRTSHVEDFNFWYFFSN